MSAPIRVLLVDDDHAVGESLRELLLGEPGAWEVRLADSGQAALAALDESPADVVVADLRMPGMDGTELLELVKCRFPATLRIVVSGRAERDLACGSLHHAHQYLSKPCEGAELAASIHRALRGAVQDLPPALRDLVGRVGALPTAPTVYAEITRIMADPGSSFGQIEDILHEDPALAAKVLQFANSAYLGLRTNVTSLSLAASMLGLKLLRGLVLTAEVFTQFTPRLLTAGFSVTAEQQHAVRVARLCAGLTPHAAWRDDAFTAGLLHDVGKLLLASRLGSAYSVVLDRHQGTRRPLHELELEELGADHGPVGGYLLGLWGLPPLVVDAVARHHEPFAPGAPLDVVRTVQVADRLGHAATPDALTRLATREMTRDLRWGEWAEMALEMEDASEAA